jgi:hypothetical protein
MEQSSFLTKSNVFYMIIFAMHNVGKILLNKTIHSYIGTNIYYRRYVVLSPLIVIRVMMVYGV